LLEGDAIAALVSEVKRGHHDLLVVAAPSGDAVNAGRATAARVVRQSPCPALLVHPGRAHRRRPRVLVAIDSGQVMRDRHRIARGLIEAGLWAAARLKGEMHVLHAWDSYGERQLVSSGVGRGELQAYRQRLRAYAMSQLRAVVAPFGDRIPADRLHLEKGDAREAIPAFAKRSETDLLVIGTAARSGLARLFIGNTAEAVLNDLPCSMLGVRPPARP
jgi:nucleotide-binding universal stress UspA family protein